MGICGETGEDVKELDKGILVANTPRPLEWSGIRFIKIETTESSADSGWREIMLFSSPEDPFVGAAQDSDSDGLLDDQDWCPDTPGDYASNGC